MAAQFERMMSQVSRWIGGSDATVPTDRQLLADYIAVKDESAFAILVRRNSPMVLGVCRRVLSHTQDSEDACQATFLILARKAASINKRESVRCWLYGVAFRVASHLRRQKSRRSTEPLVEVAVSGEDVTWREERRILDEELLRLPDQFRLPLLLCYLEGKTRDEAAEELGWSPSTFKGRLERGRERLRFRLERKGIGLSAALLATLSQTAESSAHGPTSIASLANPAGLSSVSPSVLSLAQGVLRTMLIGKVKALLGIAIVVGMLGTGVGALWNLASAEAAPPAIPAKEPSSQPAAKELPAKDPQVDKEFLAKVKKSRAAAIAWLKKTQKEDGMWEDDKNPSVRDGLTALVTLALLESGVEPADPVLAKSLKYLRGLESTYTYTVSLQTAALCRANSLKDAKTIQRNVDWLMEKAARDPKTKQLIGWSYGPNAANNADNSNTQFAVLALHAANRVGIEPKGEKNWVRVRDQYLTGQLEKGGWSYRRGGQATYSMSCASLCGLLIADSEIGQASDESKKAGERGFQWLEENDSLDVQRASYYNLYVTARLGALSKKKTFGKRDWFRDGAEWLFQQQQENGSFQGKAIDLSVPISTSFALLFLSSQP